MTHGVETMVQVSRACPVAARPLTDETTRNPALCEAAGQKKRARDLGLSLAIPNRQTRYAHALDYAPVEV